MKTIKNRIRRISGYSPYLATDLFSTIKEILKDIVEDVEEWRDEHKRVHSKEDKEIASLKKDIKKLKREIEKLKSENLRKK